ncbi:uncharacterized protein [Antedon mediterranea]|uniref:uncharacterized protein n=1 Tax=Antedon mediterranea TaxID=105859 RepID=UPI003AF5316E
MAMDKEKLFASCNPTLMRGLTSATSVAVAPLKFRIRMDYHGIDTSVSVWNNLKAWVKNHPVYSSCLAVLCGINVIPVLSFAAAYVTIKITMRIGTSLLQGVKRLLGFQTKTTKFEKEYHLSHVNQQMSEYWGRFRIVPSSQRDKKVVSLYNDVADFQMLEECTKMLQANDNTEVYSYLSGVSNTGDADSAIADLYTEKEGSTEHPDLICGLDPKQVNPSDIVPVTDGNDETETVDSGEVTASESMSSMVESTTSLEQRLSRDGLNKGKSKRKKRKRISWPFLKKKQVP